MKRLLPLLLFFLTISIAAFSQISKEQRIQDSVIGWDPNNYYDRNYKPQTSVAGKQKDVYLNKFAEWVKKSYTPVAGLGEYQRFVNTTNYFDVFHIWDVEFDLLDAHKRFRPVGETGYPRFWIGANFIPGAWNLDFMNKDDWFFTVKPDGVVGGTRLESEEKMKGRDPKISPVAAPYLTWINDMETVYLVPGNKLPMRLATKGEFLNRALERMDYVEDSLIKEDIKKEWRKDETTQANIRKYRKEDVNRSRNVIRKYLDQYKNRLNEPAYIDGFQWNWNSFDPNADDIFVERKNSILYPVYIIDAAIIKKMSDSKPLWITITFPYSKPTDGNKYQEAYKSLTQNLNYEYIYNYFFDPEKIKGVEYRPANEAALNARMEDYRRRNTYDNHVTGNTKPLSPGVVFEEDFSGDTIGSDPAAWYYYKAGAKPHIVTQVKNENGKWLKLGYGRSIKPKFLKPLPADFKLEWDVVTDGNYSGRTGGSALMELTNRNVLQNNDVGSTSKDPRSADIKISITPGNEADYNNNNYRGLLSVSVSNTPEPNEQNYNKGISAEKELRAFTDKKTKVHITLQVQNGGISILINGSSFIKPGDFKLSYGENCKLCGVPADLRFNNMLFINTTNESDKTGVYISNIKISKL